MTKRSSTSGPKRLFLTVLLLVAAIPARAAEGRDTTRIVWIGDSRLAAQFEDPQKRIANARFFGNTAAQRLDQRLRTALNLAGSGLRSDQYLTDAVVAKAVGTRSLWVVIHGVVNDIGQRGFHDYFEGYRGGPPGGVRARIERLREAGMRPILVLEPGATPFLQDPTRVESVRLYNERVRAYAASRPDVVVFDLPAAVADPASGRPYRDEFSADGIHLNNLGGEAAGIAFAALMQPLLTGVPAASPMDVAPSLAGNPGFATVTGGAVLAGVAGTVPVGYFVACTPGITAVAAVVPGEGGQVLTLTMTASAPGECTIGHDMTGEEPGRAYEQIAEVRVWDGATGFAGPYLQLQANRDGAATDAFDNFANNGGPASSAGRRLTLRTPPLLVPSGSRGWFTSRLGARFTGAGSATVTFGAPVVARTGPP